MRNVISFMLPALLSIAVILFATANAFSKTGQDANVTATSGETEAYVTGITSARAKSLIGVAAGLISLVMAWRVKRRAPVGARTARPLAITALVLGVIALVLSVTHLANVTGGFGTGGGKAGAIVALILGLIGASISGMVLRSKQK